MKINKHFCWLFYVNYTLGNKKLGESFFFFPRKILPINEEENVQLEHSICRSLNKIICLEYKWKTGISIINTLKHLNPPMNLTIQKELYLFSMYILMWYKRNIYSWLKLKLNPIKPLHLSTSILGDNYIIQITGIQSAK